MSDLSDDQIREMYWDANCSVDFLLKKSGLSLKEIQSKAGSIIVKCVYCGEEKTIRNREEWSRNRYGKKNNKLFICSSCSVLQELFIELGSLVLFNAKHVDSFDLPIYFKLRKSIRNHFNVYGIEKSRLQYADIVEKIKSVFSDVKVN